MDAPAPGSLSGDVRLRKVTEADLPVFFDQQLEPDATAMAAFPSRDRQAFMAHWTRILADETIITQTIVYDGQVAGNIVSWEQSGEREVGYWLGKAYWGKGVATRALSAFLRLVTERPLYAHVARHNRASRRVLEKCGFAIVGEDKASSATGDGEVAEWVLKLAADERDTAD